MSLPICECGHESFAHYSRYGASHCCVSSCLCERFNEPAAAPTATLSDAAERRRYALLQAAAMLSGFGGLMLATLGREVFAAGPDDSEFAGMAVDDAEELLAIIEQRQKEADSGKEK